MLAFIVDFRGFVRSNGDKLEWHYVGCTLSRPNYEIFNLTSNQKRFFSYSTEKEKNVEKILTVENNGIAYVEEEDVACEW